MLLDELRFSVVLRFRSNPDLTVVDEAVDGCLEDACLSADALCALLAEVLKTPGVQTIEIGVDEGNDLRRTVTDALVCAVATLICNELPDVKELQRTRIDTAKPRV